MEYVGLDFVYGYNRAQLGINTEYTSDVIPYKVKTTETNNTDYPVRGGHYCNMKHLKKELKESGV